MSGISDLAKSFEERSKQQASAIEQSVSNAFKQHEQSLLEALRSSGATLNAAIQAREKSLSALLDAAEANTKAMAVSGWKWLLGSLAAVALAASGALWWTGQTVAENLALIEQQKATMARAQALGIQFHQDASGLLIVLPQGMKAVTGWKLDNGRQVIKLEKEK
jgi:uncharacterized protein YicC (UPF0701 family)